MSTQNIPLFKALGAKMDFLTQRQRIISENIANSDTPGFRPQDLKPVDFSATLKKVGGGSGVTMVSTNPGHMPNAGATVNVKEQKIKKPYEVAPAGNAVVMEEQVVNSNQTQMDYNLVASLYQKNIRLIKLALGANV